MPPSTAVSMPLRAWRCPQCTQRAFSTSRPSRAVGPEHPQYLEVPEAPQQTALYRPPVKGSLPIPRNILAGAAAKDKASDDWLDAAAKRPKREVRHAAGSREEYQAQITESRRRNLREGVKSLKARQEFVQRKEDAQSARHNALRWAAVSAPEREDERLTTPSHGLDITQLLRGRPIDPNREDRLAHKRANLARQDQLKRNARLDDLHTLYTNAQNFIVSPEQLDEAVEEAFGTEQRPVMFGANSSLHTIGRSSIWAEGKPAGVRDMLSVASDGGNKAVTRKAPVETTEERVRRIAEQLTGGKLEM